MGRIAVLAVVLVLAGTGAVASAHPGDAPPARPDAAHACSPAGARAVTADRTVRVYVLQARVVACSKVTGHRYILGDRSCLGPGRTSVGPAALSGSLIAYATRLCGIDFSRSAVRLLDARTGHTLASLPATTSIHLPESFTSVTALVVGRDGALGWISVGGSIFHGPRLTQVHVHNHSGTHVLDSGSGIGARTLRLSHGRLSWRHGAGWRSAPLG